MSAEPTARHEAVCLLSDEEQRRLLVELNETAAPFSEDPFWRTAVRGLETGHSFPTLRLWGLVEDRLTAGFSAVWADLLDHPRVDPLAVLEKHLGPLAERLDLLLGQG